MHLERNILKGKFGNNKQLKKEAREELKEAKSKAVKKKTDDGCRHTTKLKTHYGYQCPDCGHKSKD